MEAYLGTILAFGCDYPPVDWAQCMGQTIQISQNNALYAVIGNYYGGTPPQNFMLPNLAGRMPIGIGPAQPAIPLPAYNIGNTGGHQMINLLVNNLPSHSHAMQSLSVNLQAAGTATSPLSVPSATNSFIGASGTGTGLATIWSTTLNTPVNVGGLSASGSTSPTGGGQAINVVNPYLALNFCIAISGLFPIRQ
ncbi:phage tail protein [Iodobacter fluviatilis]|uniref:Microcystin-dependent protein n=1 Tax=Iodobacter fluviatilis TaxID=537 RepID=A0A377SSP0_9NEIS|nr:tail fiber protein [Iodobacter fluviatilis]TCU85501.1 microcystin-dependent protein [Iodobacter fluviatilis]STR45051.1 Phage Tail Collar Domain [Iodobacter fluviatilis]